MTALDALAMEIPRLAAYWALGRGGDVQYVICGHLFFDAAEPSTLLRTRT